MTSLKAPRLLLEKESYTSVLGFCSIPDSDQILITQDSRVVLIQPYDTKHIRSWTCPSSKGHKLTGSAIFSEEDQEVVVIQSKKTVRTMKFQDFNDTETFTVKQPIHCLIAHPGSNPVVVFEDGSVYFLDDVLEDPKNIKPCSSVPIKVEAIVSVETAILDDGSLMVLIICKDGKGHNVLARIMKSNDSNINYSHARISNEDLNVVSLCTLHCRGVPTFAVLWSDRSLTNLTVYASMQTLNLEIAHVTSLQENVSEIVAISQDQVLLLSAGSLQLVDMKFGSTLEKLNIDADVTHISVLRDLIFLETSNKIQQMQFTSHPMTLAQAIMKSTRSDVSVLPHYGTWKDTPSQTALFSDKDRSLLQNLTKIDRQDAFLSAWKAVWKDRSAQFKKELCCSDVVKRILAKVGVEDDKKDFWPREALQNMIRSGHICGRWCHGLFSQILHREDWDFMHVCIKKVHDIPECLMVQCITAFMTRCIQKTGPQSNKCTGASSDLHLLSTVQSCMQEILRLQYTEVGLRDELAMMPFQAVQNFIIFLTSLLASMTLTSKRTTFYQVICWLGLLLDSHMSEIVMLEDCWPVIQRLQETVEVQSEIFKELTSISNLLTRIECRLPESEKKRSLYSVEIMRLGN